MHSDYSLMHVSQPFRLRTFWDIFLALFTLLYLQSFIECCICISSRCFAEHYNLIIFIGFNKNLLTVTKQTTMNSRENNGKFSFTLCYGPKYLVFTESIAGTKFIIFTYLALYSWSAKRDAASVNIEKTDHFISVATEFFGWVRHFYIKVFREKSQIFSKVYLSLYSLNLCQVSQESS